MDYEKVVQEIQGKRDLISKLVGEIQVRKAQAREQISSEKEGLKEQIKALGRAEKEILQA